MDKKLGWYNMGNLSASMIQGFIGFARFSNPLDNI
jgi:hypothetical protein